MNGNTETRPDDPKTRRSDFLLKMYDQMLADINRHIMVVWQSVGTLVGAIAVFALVEKQVLSSDFASAFMVVIAAWLIGHVYEGAYWYNRNLAIVANIERQFLHASDLRAIHYYFGRHRRVNSLLDQLKLQYFLAIGVAFLFLLYHFTQRVLPGFTAPFRNFEPLRALPYACVLVVIPLLDKFRRRLNTKYQEFLDRSPGIEVDTTGVNYDGIGHPSAPVTTNDKQKLKS